MTVKIFCYVLTFVIGTGCGLFLGALMAANAQDERYKRLRKTWQPKNGE